MKIFMYGDSHCRIFFRDKLNILFYDFEFVNKYKSKVSLRGLGNINSTLGVRNQILSDLDSNISDNKNIVVCLKFGQVDLEYVFYYKKYIKKQDINIISFITELVNIYLDFIRKIIYKGYKVMIISTNLPVKTTYLKSIRESLNAYINIDYTLLCKHFNLFNCILKKTLTNHNIPYLDLFPVIGRKSGDDYELKEELYGLDHHIKGGEPKCLLEKQHAHYGVNENKLFLDILVNNVLSFHNQE